MLMSPRTSRRPSRSPQAGLQAIDDAKTERFGLTYHLGPDYAGHQSRGFDGGQHF